MFTRLSRSWTLVKASAGVLRADKELLVFPLVSTICAIIVTASFVLPVFGLGLMEQWAGEDGRACSCLRTNWPNSQIWVK